MLDTNASKTKFQVCEIQNGILKHFYHSAKRNISWMSRTRATDLTLEEAREVLKKYAETEPDRNLFIQANWECHYRPVDRYGIIKGRGIAYG